MCFAIDYVEWKAAFLQGQKRPKFDPKLVILFTLKFLECAKLCVAIKAKW